MSCPCGLPAAYEACCGRFHSSAAVADTAEALMRSRYCAYAKRKIDYLVATHDPDRMGEFDALNASKWASDVQFTRLDILSKSKGRAGDETGVVEFIAWFVTDDGLSCHHEVSSFRKLGERWVYSSGEGKPAEAMFATVGRNDTCPCGSGKKFKKCHGG